MNLHSSIVDYRICSSLAFFIYPWNLNPASFSNFQHFGHANTRYHHHHLSHHHRHNLNMAQFDKAVLVAGRSYSSTRAIGDMLIGEDVARPIIEAISSGNDAALQSLLLQPQWIKIMLEKQHAITSEDRPSEGPDDAREVTINRISNLERAFTIATRNGQATMIPILLTFATQQGIGTSSLITRSLVYRVILHRHAAVFKALAAADPGIIHNQVGHGTFPIYEAVRVRAPELVALLLELGADPLRPVQPSKRLGTYNSSLLSRGAMADGPRITKMLLKHGVPIPQSSALHAAARFRQLDTMRILLQHGANVNEVDPNWSNWTPMHFAASKGQVDAMKLLGDVGARSDLKDANGKTPAQLLEEFNTVED
jgi:ankyrin repeat protein